MGHVVKTPAGNYRANWRDAAGRQKAKTFSTKKAANAFLAETEASVNKGSYVDPHAGRVRFNEFAQRWQSSRTVGVRAQERTESLLRNHVLPRWGSWPISKIDHMGLQEWVAELGRRLAPRTVKKCLGVMSQVMRAAVRSKLIAVDPSDGVTLPSTFKGQTELTTIDRERFFGSLLPAVPAEYQALVCTEPGTGLRWGEIAGLAWSAVDLDRKRLRVVQVAVETTESVHIKPYPKSRAGVRTVPLPDFVVDALEKRRAGLEQAAGALVFGNRIGTPLRRSNFRRVWRLALARAGLLGQIQGHEGRFRAVWADAKGVEWRAEFTTEREAVKHVAQKAAGGLRFHDLRHSYATWLVSDGVPVNVVQRVMGHEQASTTLNLYVHPSHDHDEDVRAVLGRSADFPLTLDLEREPRAAEPDDEDQVA